VSTLEELKDPFVVCRARRHRWEAIPDDGGRRRDYVASDRVARLAQRCERCQTIRLEAWNRFTGEILFADYRYPDDYSLKGGGVKAWNVRVEYLERQLHERQLS